MQCNQRVFLHPLYTAWGITDYRRNRALISSSTTDPTAKKAVAWLVNGVKNRLLELAFAVSSVFILIFSIITYPLRKYQFIQNAKTANDRDLARFTQAERAETETMINDYLTKHEKDFNHLTPDKKAELVKTIASQCARAEKVYAPVVKNFVDHLLETSHSQGKKLVFMARDGIAFYNVAKKLMETQTYQEKYPDLAKEKSIVLGCFSRKLVANAQKSDEKRKNFLQYAQDDLGIQDGDRCNFVDIGFEGSLAAPLRKLLTGVTCDFKFLVATTKVAEGYLGSPENPLPNLSRAQQNLGRGWVEETFSGTRSSAQDLVVGEDQKVHPDNIFPKKRYIQDAPKFSTVYLIRKFCGRALWHAGLKMEPQSLEQKAHARKIFDKTLSDINNLKFPLAVIGDYYRTEKIHKQKANG